MSKEPDAQTVAWVNQEAAKLEAAGDGMGSPREDDLIAHWRIYRPEMVRAWEALGPDMLEKLAFVLEMKAYEAQKAYLRAGMPIPDAQEEATKDWLMMEPETDTDEDLPPPLRGLAST
ncbi:MAG: hypothetical protein ABSC06_40395 [Rhodopila sp.]|jgi:hypothetical protein